MAVLSRGLDYSGSHPNLDCVVQRGYTFVARYIGDPDPNPLKYLDAPELGQLRARNLSVVACRETSAGFMFTDSGDTHARISRSHLRALGMHDAPVIYACDVDFRGLTQAQKNAGTEFLRDAARVDGGRDFVGIYGSDDAIDYWAGTDYCRWGWQTYAWSSGRISPKAHFRQHLNGQNICGGVVDLNEAYVADFGQWPRPSTPPPEPEQQEIDNMYVGIQHPDPNLAWWSDFSTKRLVTLEEMGILAFVIRFNKGTVLLTDENKPQPWSQYMVDSLPVVPTKPLQLVDFVADPDGGGAWLVLASSLRWQVGNDAQALQDHQNHWAARGYDVEVKAWDREDLLNIPMITPTPTTPPPPAQEWPGYGEGKFQITFPPPT